jgi:hypothetical protein
MSAIREVDLHGCAIVEARQVLRDALRQTSSDKVPTLKLIHGYGSSGKGGALRDAIRASLRRRIRERAISSMIPGEKWSIFDEVSQSVLERFPSLRRDFDLDRYNEGITVVVLR